MCGVERAGIWWAVVGTQGEIVAGGLDAAMDCLLKYCVSHIVGFCP
jgi:hypothetical protein